VTETPNVTSVAAPDRVVSRRVVVPAAAAQIFDLLADPGRHAELDGSGTVRGVVTGPSRLGPGDRFSVGMRLGPARYRITSVVTGFEENVLLEWRHPVGHRWRWEFAEIGPEQTQVTESWDYRDSRGQRFMELAGYPRKNADGISRTLEQLRARFAR
jgi:polyketide cyclase/dehydrase/lipid transport protein